MKISHKIVLCLGLLLVGNTQHVQAGIISTMTCVAKWGCVTIGILGCTRALFSSCNHIIFHPYLNWHLWFNELPVPSRINSPEGTQLRDMFMLSFSQRYLSSYSQEEFMDEKVYKQALANAFDQFDQDIARERRMLIAAEKLYASCASLNKIPVHANILGLDPYIAQSIFFDQECLQEQGFC